MKALDHSFMQVNERDTEMMPKGRVQPYRLQQLES
jgi:hypothetical protein